MDITAGGDFLGLCHQKSSYKHVSDFGRLRSYDLLKLRMEGNDYTDIQPKISIDEISLLWLFCGC